MAYGYEKSIFINCPFDENYKFNLYAMVYAIFAYGFEPHSALEIEGTQERMSKIIDLIKICKYGVHDLSQTALDEKNMPHFNMPFEMGLFIGAAKYGSKKQRQKSFLILVKDHQDRNAISDLGGYDFTIHKNNPEETLLILSKWLKKLPDYEPTPFDSVNINEYYNEFQEYGLPFLCNRIKCSVENLSFNDYSNIVCRWLDMVSN